mgnify:CR=1 FL=1
MKKEFLKYVDKVWGEEIWIVNCDRYCGKILIIDRNAETSTHAHNTKQETFFAIEGYAKLIVEGKEYLLAPFSRPKTIFSGEKHKIIGITEAAILEISAFHDDNDVTRFDASKPGKMDYDI